MRAEEYVHPRNTQRLVNPSEQGDLMGNTAIFILIAIAVVGAIFWLVIYAGRRGEKYRERTSIKPTQSRSERPAG